MANRKQLSPEEQRLERNRRMIHAAKWLLERTALSMLLQHEPVRFVECGREAGDPETGSVDPVKGILSLNVYRRSLSEEQWAAVIGHLLLRLGLNQAAQRGSRDPLVWNYACYESVEKLLPQLGLPAFGNEGLRFAESGEEAIYDFLQEAQHAGTPIQALKTLAGVGRPDIVGLGRFHAWNGTYETLLAEEIRLSVESAIEAASGTLDGRVKTWMPAERAKRWVMTELPLLGALASHITIIARAELCERMDISVAAVNGDLMEMYFNPKWRLTQAEVLFIYVHELLHVALMHHSRAQGRDSLMWNFACDFVINGWLVEMGVGKLPSIGALYDPRLQGMSAEAVYDLLAQGPKRFKNLRGFRGKLGDVLITPRGQIYKDEVTTLDDLVRRCMATGLACTERGRGTVPAGLLEEIRSLFTPPVPWDVELARWMDAHIPALRDPLRTYARASRRQSSTPDIPRPARYIPQEWKEAHTFGVVLDTSGSMDRGLLGRALGAIASYAEARDVLAVRLVLCDAAPYDRGIVAPTDLRGIFSVQGRGGTVLQPAINFLLTRSDFPLTAPIMIITDGWCEEELIVPREHCFLLPRKSENQKGMPLRTTAPLSAS